MNQDRLIEMNITANILSAFYSARNSFCILHQKEPDAAEKDQLLKEVISMFENLSTSYYKDIEEIANSAR